MILDQTAHASSATSPAPDMDRQRRFALIILAYPAALITAAVAVNLLVFGISPIQPALPEPAVLRALIIAGLLLLAGHTALMTSTELTRLWHGLFATPEEWAASGRARADVSARSWAALERQHNAHRNLTENTVQFALLALAYGFAAPVTLAAQVWIIGFALARLGHAGAYLAGRDGLRGIFMSLSLLALYGIASALAIGLLA